MTINNRKNTEGQEVELLQFVLDDHRASIATNGRRSVAQIGCQCYEFNSLMKAISFLSARGYNVLTDECTGL